MLDAQRVAAIDCGTNSIRLLVADVDIDGTKTDLAREMRIVRLGQGVDRTGFLAEEAIERTLAALREYAVIIADHGVQKIRFCATSATRDATNSAEFGQRVERVIGVRPEVISGLSESRFSYVGATWGLPPGSRAVLDIGGGSTELVLGDKPLGPDVGESYDIGSVRMTERFLHADPPTLAEIGTCLDACDRLIGRELEKYPPVSTLIGVAGTITTVAAHALELPRYDSEALHGARIPVAEMTSACLALASMSVAERRDLPFMHPGRADVIGGGALVLDSVLSHLPLQTDEIVISEHDILDGIALSFVLPLDQP